MLNADVVLYTDGTEGEKYSNMSCIDIGVDITIGRMKVVFVYKFINDLLVIIFCCCYSKKCV